MAPIKKETINPEIVLKYDLHEIHDDEISKDEYFPQGQTLMDEHSYDNWKKNMKVLQE